MTSTVFETMQMIGDRCFEWDATDLPTEWLLLYLFATIDEEEFSKMLQAGELARNADPNDILNIVVALRRVFRLGNDLSDPLPSQLD